MTLRVEIEMRPIEVVLLFHFVGCDLLQRARPLVVPVPTRIVVVPVDDLSTWPQPGWQRGEHLVDLQEVLCDVVHEDHVELLPWRNFREEQGGVARGRKG